MLITDTQSTQITPDTFAYHKYELQWVAMMPEDT